jgi:hypothetical protein
MEDRSIWKQGTFANAIRLTLYKRNSLRPMIYGVPVLVASGFEYTTQRSTQLFTKSSRSSISYHIRERFVWHYTTFFRAVFCVFVRSIRISFTFRLGCSRTIKPLLLFRRRRTPSLFPHNIVSGIGICKGGPFRSHL